MIRRWFPNARIVADRFHVVRVLLTHFMDLCRQIAPVVKSHRGHLALLRMAPERLEPDQLRRLQNLFDQHPALAALHERMHALRELLNVKNQTRRRCRPLISKLLLAIDELKASGFPPFNPNSEVKKSIVLSGRLWLKGVATPSSNLSPRTKRCRLLFAQFLAPAKFNYAAPQDRLRPLAGW